jgi:hypothetical protein
MGGLGGRVSPPGVRRRQAPDLVMAAEATPRINATGCRHETRSSARGAGGWCARHGARRVARRRVRLLLLVRPEPEAWCGRAPPPQRGPRSPPASAIDAQAPGRDHPGVMRRRTIACFAALAMSAASLIDNPASCREDAPQGAAPSDRPLGTPHDSCAGMPCQAPGVHDAPLLARPLFELERMIALVRPEPQSADAPAPPTPPPTASV